MNFTVLVSFVRLMRTKHLWQKTETGFISFFCHLFLVKFIQERLQRVCFLGFFFSDAPDVSGRDIWQIMSLLFFLSTWNPVLLPEEFRTDH